MEWKISLATQPFHARCGHRINTGAVIAWNNSGKARGETGVSYCVACQQALTASEGTISPAVNHNNTIDCSVPVKGAEIDPEVISTLRADINALKDQAARLNILLTHRLELTCYSLGSDLPLGKSYVRLKEYKSEP